MSLCRDMMPHWELRAALDNAEAKVAEQAAEIERLRAALVEIEQVALSYVHMKYAKLAREALAEEKKDDR